MFRLRNILLTASIVLGLSFSAPIMHSHELDGNQSQSAQLEMTGTQVLFELAENDPVDGGNGHNGEAHNCCSHHCHSSHAMMGTDACPLLPLPVPPSLFAGIDESAVTRLVYSLKRPPRTA